MDCISLFLHDAKSVPYHYEAYISPTGHYPIVVDSNGNEYVVVDIPQSATDSSRSDVYLNWIDAGNADFIHDRIVETYAPLIELVWFVEKQLPLADLLEKYGLLETNEHGQIEKYVQDGWYYQPYYGFELSYVKRKMILLYCQYQAWLSFIDTGEVLKQHKYFTRACCRYQSLISIDEHGHPEERRTCRSWIELAESQLGDLFLLGNKVLDDQSIFRCQVCGKRFIGAFNKNKRLCPQCDTPAAKQKRYRARLKEATHASKEHA